MALGVTYLVAQLVGLAIIDRVGRRRLTLIMIPGAALSLFVLGLAVRHRQQRPRLGAVHHRVPDRVHALQRGRTAADGLADGLGDLPAGRARRGHGRQSAALWGTNLLITLTLLTLITGLSVSVRRCGSTACSTWPHGFSSTSGCRISPVGASRRSRASSSDGKFRPADFAELREEGQFGLHYHPQSAQGLV